MSKMAQQGAQIWTAVAVGAVVVAAGAGWFVYSRPPAPEVVTLPISAPAAPVTAAQDLLDEIAAEFPPSLDVLRVAPDGGALLSGVAMGGVPLLVEVDGQVMAQTLPGADEQFVVMFELGFSDAPQMLTLATQLPDSTILYSSESHILATRPAPTETPAPVPVVEIQPEPEPIPVDFTVTASGAVRVVDPQPVVVDNLRIDAISYTAEGEVAISGRAPREGGSLRLYLDNRPVAQVSAGVGAWVADLPDVAAGTYTLRVDELDVQGRIVERVELPIRREAPEIVMAAFTLSQEQVNDHVPARIVTIQPGNTLWAIARERYGDGNRYVQIFEANRATIRNPDLIFPGQIFDLPE